MTLGGPGRRRVWSRLLIVAAAVGSVGVEVGLSAGPERWYLGLLGLAYLVLLVGVGVVVVVWRRLRSARFALTRAGFAPRPTVPLELAAAFLLTVLGGQVRTLVRQWREVANAEPSDVAVDVAFAGQTSVLVAVLATMTALVVLLAWRGPHVEVTPAGVRSRALLHERLIPWSALGPEGARYGGRGSGRLRLVVARPELVVQRGRNGLSGTPAGPSLRVDGSDGWFLANAIRWYLEHPADRAAIGTQVELDRLVATLAAAPFGAEPEPAPEGTVAPVAIPRRRVRAAATLVYVAVAVALVTATAELVITIVFRANLLAAQRAIAGPVLPSDGVVIFDSASADFALQWATIILVGTFLVAVVAVALAHETSRGSRAARVGLFALCILVALLALCPTGLLTIDLTTAPEAGTLFNVWPAVRMAEGFTVFMLAVTVVVLLLWNPGPVATADGP